MKSIRILYLSILSWFFSSPITNSFLVIPPTLRGQWRIENEKEGSFLVEDYAITAQYRSAEISMTVRHMAEEEKRLNLHNVTVLRQPILWDVRKMIRGLKYFHAIQKEGITLQYVWDGGDQLTCEWSINPEMQGKVRLVRDGFDDSGPGSFC